jgi:uncharacterized membrane protein YphA (DoxX/SURF4 family)
VPSLDTLLRLAVAAILLWAAASKLTTRPSLRWLGAIGVPARLRGALFIAVALAEASVGVLLLAGVETAAYAAVALGILFCVALAAARARGIRRLECGCFGAKERSIDFVLARALGFTALAGLAAARPSTPSRDAIVLIVVGLLALAVVVLAGLVLALYRQVGVLTLRVGPGVALELAEEGPAVGGDAPPLDGLTRLGSELAVFFSADCRLCRSLAPGVRALAREGLPVHVVYEEEAPDTFEHWRVPGTPFAVHLVDGIVAAKGTVNTLEQLDGLLATGRGRTELAAV